ncbi:MAG: hypothetical protein JWP37_3134 [Mucilaginibacter sp.]|nr:hypothetical protein [Mucilaginibacter sp.]
MDQPVRTKTKSSASKLSSSYDKLLKNMLIEDLKSFKAKNEFVYTNQQMQVQVCLSVA